MVLPLYTELIEPKPAWSPVSCNLFSSNIFILFHALTDRKAGQIISLTWQKYLNIKLKPEQNEVLANEVKILLPNQIE